MVGRALEVGNGAEAYGFCGEGKDIYFGYASQLMKQTNVGGDP